MCSHPFSRSAPTSTRNRVLVRVLAVSSSVRRPHERLRKASSYSGRSPLLHGLRFVDAGSLEGRLLLRVDVCEWNLNMCCASANVAASPLWTEALTVLVIYLAYEVSRGITVGDPSVALHHAHQVAHLEQSLSIFVEREVQVVAKAIPGLLGVLGAAYLGLHLTVSIGCLVWVYRYHPSAFTMLRNTLVLATAIAMIGYIAFPTAPPRLAGMGIVDTVSNGHVDLNTGLVHSLYNPFAAMPSLHFGYAVIIGASAVALSRHRAAQLAGVAYPVVVLFVIVATGNHFLLDALAGALVAGAAAVGAHWLTRSHKSLEDRSAEGGIPAKR